MLGLEGAVGLADMDWDNDLETSFIAITASEEVTAELDWFASASLRAGWLASPETMIYVIGGYSHAEFDFDSTFATAGFTSSADETKGFDGFHAGAGIEAMLSESLSARVEYRYTNYGAHDIGVAEESLGGLDFNPSTHTGMIGIAWLFNGL